MHFKILLPPSFVVFVDRLTLVLYNSWCKIIVKRLVKELRLLIVEDEKQICDTVAKSLYAVGYEVDTCYDGGEALEYILTENYDLVVLDLNLPGMDGMEILKELRQSNEETKVLIHLQEGRLRIRLKHWMRGQMIIWKSPSICRSLRRVSEA